MRSSYGQVEELTSALFHLRNAFVSLTLPARVQPKVTSEAPGHACAASASDAHSQTEDRLMPETGRLFWLVSLLLDRYESRG